MTEIKGYKLVDNDIIIVYEDGSEENVSEIEGECKHCDKTYRRKCDGIGSHCDWFKSKYPEISDDYNSDSEWEGTDLDLEISLEEYNFVAKQKKNRDYPDEWFVLYKWGGEHYDTGSIRESELDDIVNGKEWANENDIKSFLSFVSQTKSEWLKNHFPIKFFDLTQYWGFDNIIGGSYYPFTQKEAHEMIGINQ